MNWALVNHARTELFSIDAALAQDPDNPTLLKRSRDKVAELDELGDDGSRIHDKYMRFYSGASSKAPARSKGRKR